MELRLKRHDKDPYPACGFFVEGDDLITWIAAIDRLGLDPTRITVYGLPGTAANSVWGGLVLTTVKLPPSLLGPLASAHLVAGRLVVPAKALVVPKLTDYDLPQLFREDRYVLHPEFSLFKLAEPVDLEFTFAVGKVPILNSARPADYTVSTGEISAFSVAATPAAELEVSLGAGVEREKMRDKPLSLSEKLRLKMYRSVLFTNDGKANLRPNADKLQRLTAQLGISGQEAYEKLLDDFKDLEERNKKEVDKLVSLMETDPEAALRYAIPLDEHGYSRGKDSTKFTMQDRGGNFSLFGRAGGGGGGTVGLGDEFYRLREQYTKSARELEKRGKHEKAAYVYLKLLKDYTAAAQTLRAGQHFEKAAVVYVRYAKNEWAAAECYEEGKIYTEAIPLYAKLEEWEKVGDLNVLRGDAKAAMTAYQLQLAKELEKPAYVKAAKLSIEKMQNLPQAQEILLRGWEENTDAHNCLRYYLSNLQDEEATWLELQRIGRHQLNPHNDTLFVKILADEYKRSDQYQGAIKSLAYEIISDLLAAGRISAHELVPFNQQDKRLRADAVLFETNKRRRL